MAHSPATHEAADGIGGRTVRQRYPAGDELRVFPARRDAAPRRSVAFPRMATPRGLRPAARFRGLRSAAMLDRRMPVRPIRTVIVAALLMGVAVAAPPDDVLKPVRRIRGIIDQDETWAGHIIITGDLQVAGAVVTIHPGTLIEFADATPGSGPALTVGSPNDEDGELRVLATPKEPVTFRTRPGTWPGRIIIHLHDRHVASPRGVRSAGGVADGSSERPATLTWQHIRFEQLGGGLTVRDRPRTASAPSPAGAEADGAESAGADTPAIAIHLDGGGQRVTITDCELTRCARLLVAAGDRSVVTLRDNQFREGRYRVDLAVSSGGRQGKAAMVTLARNTLTAALLVDGPPARIEGNLLVGLNASIVVRGVASAQTRVEGNYVHNTTRHDDGRYCLSIENPDARVENNIFHGGSVCVHHGSRHMAGNVMIAAARLDAVGAHATATRELVSELPCGSVFERNILLGPAHSMLVPQPAGSRSERKPDDPVIRVRRNTFDGFGTTARAIHLNPAGRLPAEVSVSHNLFVRVRSLVFDESRGGTTLVHADRNAYAPPPSRPFDRAVVVGVRQGQLGWASGDIERPGPAQLGLLHVPDGLPTPDDDALLSGRKTLAGLRAEYDAFYRPQIDSPLCGAPDSEPVGAVLPN